MSWEKVALILIRLLAQSGPEFVELRREIEAAVAEGRPLNPAYIERSGARYEDSYVALLDANRRADEQNTDGA